MPYWVPLTIRMFGCGTGVVVVSIGQIQYKGKMHEIPYNPLVLLLRDTITGMQRGRIEHEWSHKVPAWKGARAENGVQEADAEGMAA